MRVAICNLVLVSKYENGLMIISISSRQVRVRKIILNLVSKNALSLEVDSEILNPTQLQGFTEGNHIIWFLINDQKHAWGWISNLVQTEHKFFCGVWKTNSKSHLSAAWCLLLTPVLLQGPVRLLHEEFEQKQDYRVRVPIVNNTDTEARCLVYPFPWIWILHGCTFDTFICLGPEISSWYCIMGLVYFMGIILFLWDFHPPSHLPATLLTWGTAL